MRSAISDSAVRPVVIVLLDPTSDRCSRFFQAPILRRPDFLFLQAAMEPFDVAVAFRVMIRRPPMGDAEPSQRFQEPRRSELRPVVGRQRQVRLAASCGKPIQHGLLDRCQRVFGPAAMREIPSHDLPRAAVDHAHQIRPAHGRPRPDLGHVRLPDLIRLGWLPRGPTLSSVVPADDASAPATHVRASPVTPACDSRGSPFFRCSHHATRR